MIDNSHETVIVVPDASQRQPIHVGAANEVIWQAQMPLPRDPAVAEREELDAALRACTPEAIRHFLERHPESRFRKEAEAALDTLTCRR